MKPIAYFLEKALASENGTFGAVGSLRLANPKTIPQLQVSVLRAIKPCGKQPKDDEMTFKQASIA